VLHDQEVVLLGLDHFVQLHDVRVADSSEDLYFSPHAHPVVVRGYLVFLQHLHCDLLFGQHVHGFLHFAERAFSEVLQDDVGLVLRVRGRHPNLIF
jgi:hypothetical protein